jgi:tRNA pseudouridine-54 N-methylase
MKAHSRLNQLKFTINVLSNLTTRTNFTQLSGITLTVRNNANFKSVTLSNLQKSKTRTFKIWTKSKLNKKETSLMSSVTKKLKRITVNQAEKSCRKPTRPNVCQKTNTWNTSTFRSLCSLLNKNNSLNSIISSVNGVITKKVEFTL